MTSSKRKFAALLAICEGNPQVTGGFPSQRPVTRSFDVFFWSTPEQTAAAGGDAGDLDAIAFIMTSLQWTSCVTLQGNDNRHKCFLTTSLAWKSVGLSVTGAVPDFRVYIGTTYGIIRTYLDLPAGLTCSQCVLQWKYNAGKWLIYCPCDPHEGVVTWKRLPHYWTLLRGISWSLINSIHKGPVMRRRLMWPSLQLTEAEWCRDALNHNWFR